MDCRISRSAMVSKNVHFYKSLVEANGADLGITLVVQVKQNGILKSSLFTKVSHQVSQEI